MASSVARMPSSEEWRDHGRLSAAVFTAAPGRTSLPAVNLKKVLVRQQQRSDVPPPSSSSSLALAPVGNPIANEEGGGSPAPARARKSHILDQWATRQARDMVTTLERQVHRTEVSALTTHSQPVSVRAASLLREGAPALPGPSTGSAAPAPARASGTRDMRPNVRASSLIQMWRELEAEAGLTPRNRTASGCSNADNGSSISFSVDEPSGGQSDGSDESDAYGDWQSDTTTTVSSEQVHASSSTSLNENEKSRVGSIVRMLSSEDRKGTCMWALNIEAPRRESTVERSYGRTGSTIMSPRRLMRGRGEMENFVTRREQERQKELVALAEHQQVSRFAYRGRIQSMLKLRSIRGQLVVQDQPRAPSRRLELNQSHHGSTISFLRERFDHRGHHCGSRKPTLESSSSILVQFPMGTKHSDYTSNVHVQFPMDAKDSDYTSDVHVQFPMGTKHSDYTSNVHVQFPMDAKDSDYTSNVHVQYPMDAKDSDYTSNVHVQFPMDAKDSDYTSSVDVQFPMDTKDSDFSSNVHVQFPMDAKSSDYTSNVHVQFPMHAEGSGYRYSTDQFTGHNNQYQEIVFSTDLGSTPPELNSLRCDDLQEGSNHSIDGYWDERNIWVSNLDWQRPSDSLPSNGGWHGEAAAEELESYPQQNVDSWMGEHSNSWRGWSVSRKTQYHDFFENFSDNVEIRDLLERRRVSTSLASDFCEKMNRLILSFLNRQAQQCFNENFAENHVDHQYWQQGGDEYQNVEPIESVSSSLVPLQYHTLQHPESWQHASVSRQSSHINALDMEMVHELKSDMAQIHEEISELRSMVESCMDWQAKLRQSIKQDILDAINQSNSFATAGPANTLHNFGVKSGRNGTCYICQEMQVDSLLYRCGHMCTCFDCACQLQWSNGKCPMCRSPIVDVVRAFPNS